MLLLGLQEGDLNLSCRLLDLKKFQDGCAVIRDRHIANVINEHFVEPRRPQGRFDDVCDAGHRRDILRPDVLHVDRLLNHAAHQRQQA